MNSVIQQMPGIGIGTSVVHLGVKKKMWVGSCVYAWVTVAIRFLYKHCMLVLSIQWINRKRELDLVCMHG